MSQLVNLFHQSMHWTDVIPLVTWAALPAPLLAPTSPLTSTFALEARGANSVIDTIFSSFLRFFQFLCSISNKILCSCFTLLTLALTNLISPLSLSLYFYSILFKKIKTNTLSPFLSFSLPRYPFSDSCSFRHFFLLLSFLLL